ncbi:hypothetical protein RJ639_019420 [Escallonia herrerae]|uniref:UspA domain-containing protein n=1 Tax=Escallonia herrerae TaxID=1293975 RepID=A0AA89AJ23_9ASTE|nr:hypothetical protein RJ639_019420 [Escallonia herrerae]
MAEKQVMVVGIDDSEHSFYALEWTLDHFFTPESKTLFKLVVMASNASKRSTDVLPLVEADLKRIAEKVSEKAQDLCSSKSVEDVTVETIEGDARNVMCEAAEKYHASVLVLGSHGYGAFKRAVLGSVSDYCSHHAHCSVMIVKKPKQKN